MAGYSGHMMCHIHAGEACYVQVSFSLLMFYYVTALPFVCRSSLSACLSIFLFSLSACLPVCQSVCLFILSVCLSTCLFVSQSVCLSVVYPSACQLVCPSSYQLVRSSACLSVSLCVHYPFGLSVCRLSACRPCEGQTSSAG